MEFKAILMTCTIALIVISVIQKITRNDMIKACTAISALIALLFGAWAINVILAAGDDD